MGVLLCVVSAVCVEISLFLYRSFVVCVHFVVLFVCRLCAVCCLCGYSCTALCRSCVVCVQILCVLLFCAGLVCRHCCVLFHTGLVESGGGGSVVGKVPMATSLYILQ